MFTCVWMSRYIDAHFDLFFVIQVENIPHRDFKKRNPLFVRCYNPSISSDSIHAFFTTNVWKKPSLATILGCDVLLWKQKIVHESELSYSWLSSVPVGEAGGLPRAGSGSGAGRGGTGTRRQTVFITNSGWHPRNWACRPCGGLWSAPAASETGTILLTMATTMFYIIFKTLKMNLNSAAVYPSRNLSPG